MNADIKGALNQINKAWRCFEHKGKQMSKAQVKAVLEYGYRAGYKTVADIPEAEIDLLIIGID